MYEVRISSSMATGLTLPMRFISIGSAVLLHGYVSQMSRMSHYYSPPTPGATPYRSRSSAFSDGVAPR